jgi:hypothetical protein
MKKNKADELKSRLVPKLGIFFDPKDQICVHETFLGDDKADRVSYIAAVPIARTDATVSGCRGWLTDVRKLGSDKQTWEATSFTTRRQLEWSAIGFEPMDINPGMRQALNVVRIRLADGDIFPCVPQLLILNKDAQLFEDRNGVFRFDIAVIGQKGPVATHSLRLELDSASNKPNVRAE